MNQQITAPDRATAQAALLRELVAPVAARIRAARRVRQLTAAEAARLSGLRPATLCRVESGQQGLTFAAVRRIAQALAIDDVEFYPGGRPEEFWRRVSAVMQQSLAPAEQLSAVAMPVQLPLAA